jgi:hypothetical protein
VYKKYAGVNHTDVVFKAAADATRWLRARLKR